MSKFTPGPWNFIGNGFGWSIYDVNGQSIQHDYGIASEADARLIAAAPDMLAALKAAEFRLEFLNARLKRIHLENTETVNTLSEIRAAISRAEGGA